MPFNAVTQKYTINENSVINRTHPPVIVTKKTDASVKTPFKKGTILVSGDNGVAPMAAYDAAAEVQQETVGVAVNDFDPDHGDLVEVLVHGTVTEEMLDADADQIALLVSQHPIYAI